MEQNHHVWERAMRCGSCGQQNRDGARFCDSCGATLGPKEWDTGRATPKQCISCGKDINLGVYFTMCPHCGFNYRIEITPVRPQLAATRRSAAFLYTVSILVPMAGFVVGAVLWRDTDPEARRNANECVILASLNIIIAPILILRCFNVV